MAGTASTVLYDEGCGMCTALAEWLADHSAALVVAPIGSEVGERLLRDLDLDERYATVHVVDPAGRRSSGGAAVPIVFAALPYGRPAAWLARRIPFATELGYELVARHRGTISRLLGVSRGSPRATRPPPAGARSRGGRRAS